MDQKLTLGSKFRYGLADLGFALITSAARVEPSPDGVTHVTASASPYTKCERCWHYCADTGQHADHPGLCGRCYANLFGQGETRHHV